MRILPRQRAHRTRRALVFTHDFVTPHLHRFWSHAHFNTPNLHPMLPHTRITPFRRSTSHLLPLATADSDPPPPLSHTVRVSLTQMLHLWRAPGDSCRARTQPSAHARARAARARTRRREPCGAATGRLLSMRRLARGRPRDLSPWARPRFAPSRLLGKGRIPLLRRVQGGGADAAEWRCTRACRGGASHLLSHTCHAGCHTQHVTRRVSHAGCHTQHVTRSMPHAACHTQHVTRSMPHAGCHTQDVTHNVTHDVS